MFSLAMATGVTSDEVRARIRGLWKSVSEKAKDQYEALYAPMGTVVSSSTRRPETARLSLARRGRQFFDPTVSVVVELGAIEVQMVPGEVAIATYPYVLRSVKLNRDGTRTERETPHGRATQIFQRDEHGALRVVHEHLSSGKRL
jgi:ketosteroid isomerase-like protein